LKVVSENDVTLAFINKKSSHSFLNYEALSKTTDKKVKHLGDRLRLKYKKIESKLLSFFYILFTAKLFYQLDKPFFYTWFMCFRSRVYPLSYLTNPHGLCFAQ
jgi:hypothetical protein